MISSVTIPHSPHLIRTTALPEPSTITRESLVTNNGHAAAPNLAPDDSKTPPDWTIDDAIETYNIDRWGLGYFGINEKGNVTVSPLREQGATMDLMDVISDASEWEVNRR